MQLRSSLVLALAMFAGAASAHDYKLQDLAIGHPYARATMPGQPSSAAYLTIENHGKTADKLIAASAPVAQTTELHTMTMENHVMKMRQVDGIEVQPATKVEMKPGQGYHIMLLGLQQQLKAGDKFPLTLTFEKAGKLEVSVHVEEVKAPAGGHHHSH